VDKIELFSLSLAAAVDAAAANFLIYLFWLLRLSAKFVVCSSCRVKREKLVAIEIKKLFEKSALK
jgi:hypothetical protein